MGYVKYHYNQTMNESMLNQFEKEPEYTVTSGTTHYHYISPYYAGEWLVWHIPTYYSDGYYTYATTSHSKSNDDPEDSSYEDGDKYDYYYNFNAITGINFLNHSGYNSVGLYVGDKTTANNLTFGRGGVTAGESATLSNLTFTSGGTVVLGDTFSDGEGDNTVWYATTDARLTTMKAKQDFDYVVALNGASSYIKDVEVGRNMRDLSIAAPGGSYGFSASRIDGNGTVVSQVKVGGRLNSVYVGKGAVLDTLNVGSQRSWGAGDVSAFGYFSSSYAGSGGRWVLSSATYMTVDSGGTATNIHLENGGQVTVMGPSTLVTSTYDSATSQWVVTSSEGSGTGGTLSHLFMATSGGLKYDGLADYETWNYPTNGYGNRPYMNGYLATAPQSSYVSFGSNASGSNINIGNGGSLYIGKDAHVSAISMGGLTTSTFFKNSSGTTDTWIGDRGAKLQINGGKVSGVVMDPVIQTFEYYSAAHDYFWLYSSSVSSSMQAAYSSAHGEYASGSAWQSAVYASASAGYRQYMRDMYTSGAVYTNLGDDTAYNRRYVGGDIGVAGGWIMNVSGFSYLGVAADVDVTVSNNVSTWKTYQYTDGNVSKAIGAVSATLDVTGGAHVYNVKIEGGRVIMTGGGEVNARWHSRENKQSNYNLVEDLDLRIGDVLGLGSAYPAVIQFFGEGSGGYSQAIHDSKGGVTGYVDYFWDAIDPGEIHSVTASKGLVVFANYNKQDFTYIGSGAVTINGLGTVVLKDNHSRYTSDSYYGKGPYLGSAFDTYYFGVVKGVYNEEDGTLENYTVLDGTDGGFDWTGFLMVGSGGIVQNIGSAAPLKTGNDIVNSDTWTPSYTRDECKVLTVVAGGLADNVTVKGAVSNFEHYESQYTESRAGLLVSSGGTATNVTVLEGGIAMAKGGTIDKVFVAGGGTLYLSGWAGAHQVAVDSYGSQLAGPQYLDTTVLNAVRLDSGGQLTNTLDWGFRKGNAPSVIANKGGGIMNGVTANGVAYVSGLDFAGNITLTKDQQAIDVTVRGYKTITSRDEEGNPTAYNTTIASLNVSSGGIVKGATVGEDGAIYASNGADMSGLVASGGRIIFANSSGWNDYFAGSATVKGITVRDGGSLEVNSKFGLTATDVKIEQDAGLTFTLGKTANEDYTPTALNGTWTADWGNGTFQTNDGVLTGFGGQFGHEYRDLFYSSAYVSARLSMTIVEGGVLAGGDLRGYGSVLVKNGGRMLDTKLQGVGASIAASGYASGISATVASGKNAYGTNIYVYGSGAVADATVLNGGYMGVERGGVVNSVTMLCPEGYEGPAGNDTQVGPVEFEVMAGGTANNVIASAGVITLLDGSKEPGTAGPTLSNADVHSAAMLIVKGDGAVLDGTLNLAGTVFTTGKRYEYMEVEVEVEDPDNPGQMIKQTEWRSVEMNNSIADATTLTVNFDLTELEAPGETAMIDNLSNLTGVKLDRISVNADQTQGAYVLAGGAEDYNGSLKVVRDGKFAGTITVGGFLQVTEDLTYSLMNTAEEGLVFSVMSTDAAITDIIATSDGKELLKGKWSKYAVTIKTEVNQYSKSIWYRIKQAVKPKTRGHLLYAPGDVDDDGWIELDNEKGITISEYCTIELKAKNEKGKDSKIVEYTVNYDATAPDFAELSLVSGEPFLTPGVESAVVVSVTDDLDDAPAVQLSLNDGVWTDVVRNDDGTYVFNLTGGIAGFTLRAVDHAENETVLSVSVPADPVVSADILTVTNQDVTLSAAFSADSTLKQYSLDGGTTWLDYGDGVVLTDNGTVSFRAGNILGYSGIATLTVDYIDKVAPEKPVASANITELTNRDVTVTATFSDDSVVKEYTLDGETWQAYDEGGVIIIINGTVGFRGTDAAGNVSEVENFLVANIDKEPPTAPAVSADTTELVNNGTVIVTATFSEDSIVKEYSLDGETWQAYTDPLVFEENGEVIFRGTDAAGNVSEVTGYEVNNIVHVEPYNGPDDGQNDNPIENGELKEPDSVNEVTEPNGEIFVDQQYSVEVEKNGTQYHNCVGGDDKADYAQLKLDKAAKLSFTINATDKVKMTLYRVVEGKKGASMKSLSSVSLSKPGETGSKKPVFVEAGEYFIGVEGKNKKADETFYNISLNDGTAIYSDGDEGGNNGPLLVTENKKKIPSANIANFLPVEITESGVQAVQFDTNVIEAADAPDMEGGWNNFVGFGDSEDYVKLSATQPLKLNFSVTSTDKVKLTVYKLTLNKGKWSSSSVKSLTVSLKSAEKNNPGYATRSVNGILLDRITDGLDDGAGYYVSVQSTNASKGGSAWYNVNVESTVYASDTGTNNALFLDKKNKELNSELGQTTVKTGDRKAVVMENDDVGIMEESFNSFVGFGDEYDYAEIKFDDTGDCTFTVDTWGTEKSSAKFTVYQLTFKKGKWTKKSLATLTLKNTEGAADGYASASDGRTVRITEKTNEDTTRYFVSMQSVDAKKGKEVYYNITATMPSEANGSALTMPEMDSLSDSLAMPDELSFGQYDTDVLAGTCLDPASDKLFGESGGLLA